MRTIRGLFPLLLLFVLVSAFLPAQSAASDPGRFPLVFDIVPVLWGADIGVGYRGLPLFSGVDTIFWLYGGGAYEQLTYRRLPDGTLITDAAPGNVDPTVDPYYYRWSARWQLGIAQGILWNPRIEANRLEAFLFYRGRYDSNQQDPNFPNQLLFQSSLPDRFGVFQNALLAGLTYNDRLFDVRHKMKNGVSAEVSVEWAPAGFFNTVFGSSDYARLNFTARGFLPLFDVAPENENNLFCVYLADFFSADYAVALGTAPVPLNIRQSFGGLDPRQGLGNAVRGVDDGSLDTNLKLVNNFEVRANLPALWLRDIVPGVLLYWDVGYYSQVGEAVASPASGFVSSIGAGIFLDVFDLTSLAIYIHYRLIGVNANGNPLTPFEFEFDLQF